MSQVRRIVKIRELFNNQEFASFDELCAKFGASRSSIRRDLVELEHRGVVRRVHGGAVSLRNRAFLEFTRAHGVFREEKVRIGKRAAKLVEDGQTVILGRGSTVAEVAKSLAERPVQVVTNSLPVAQVLWGSRHVEVTLTGGYLYPRLGIQLGPVCERMLQGVSGDILIMGIPGIAKDGISDSNNLIVGSIRAMIQAARRVVIVAHHSKFGQDPMIHVADFQEVNQVVSDRDLDPGVAAMLRENNVECILV